MTMNNLRRAIRSGEYPKEAIIRSVAGRYAIVKLGNHRGALTMRVRLAAGLQPNVGDTVILSRVGEDVMALSIAKSSGTVLTEEKVPPPPTASTVTEGAPPDEGGSGIVEGSEAGGDLSGYYPDPTVAAIQGRLVAPDAPNDNDVLAWDATDGMWRPQQNIASDPTMGGDVSGTASSATVVGIQNRPVSSAAPATGQALRWDGTSWAPGNDLDETDPVYLADKPNILFVGSMAGGDLSGTYPNPTVNKIQGRPVSATAPANGQALIWNGTEWAPGNVSGGGGNELTNILFALQVTRPTLSDGWTWFNQGNSSIEETARGLELYSPGDPNYHIMGVYLPYPTPPFVITALVVYDILRDANYMGGGIGIRESSSTKSEYIRFTLGIKKIEVLRSNNDTSHNSSPAAHGWWPSYPAIWFQYEDNGTNRIWRYSYTGAQFTVIASYSIGDYITPDQVTFFINPQEPVDIQVTLASFDIS